MISLLLSLVLTTGCRSDKDVEDTAPAPLADDDNDGFTEDVDCDDLDASVNPDAVEVCDGVDNNCNSEVDEGLGQTLYADADGDGYGDENTSQESCEALLGWVLNADDCDDTDPAFHPGAAEADCTDPADYNCDGSVGYADGDGDGWAACQECDDGAADINPAADETCDEVDNNCNGTIDEDSAIDAATWYLDADGDTYGSSKSAFERQACEQPEGYSDNNLDCDDLDPVVNPDTIWYADSDGDSYGSPDDSLQICAQPEGYVLDDQDCDDADAERNPDTIWFEDGDADGYGATTSITTSCEEPLSLIHI